MELPNPQQRIPCALALIFAALLCGCGGPGKTADQVADDMARHFTEQRFTEAYGQAASAFRFTRSANYFEARVRDLGLCEARGVKWGEPERNGRLATVRGTFTLKNGGTLPLNFIFTMEDGEWRLIEAKSAPPPGGGKAEDVFAVASRSRDTMSARAMEILEPNAADVPAEPQLRQLAEESLLLFNDAIQNGGDFTAFYAACSNRWKYRGRDPRELSNFGSKPNNSDEPDPYNAEGRLTLAALRTAFAAAIVAKVDFSPIKGTKMILSQPARVNSDGVLNLRGTFEATVYQAGAPGTPRKLDFALEYVCEATQWKLFGITVNILTAGNPQAKNP